MRFNNNHHLFQKFSIYNQFIMINDNKPKTIQKQMVNSLSLYESTTSIKSISLKQSQLLKKFKEPPDINLYQMQSSKSQNQKSAINDKNMKVKKFESVDTNSTQQNGPNKQEKIFISKYKQDPIFRIKIQNMRKQNQKMRQKHDFSIETQSIDNKITTWRSQKHLQSKELISLYERCKKWIQKATTKN